MSTVRRFWAEAALAALGVVSVTVGRRGSFGPNVEDTYVGGGMRFHYDEMSGICAASISLRESGVGAFQAPVAACEAHGLAGGGP